MSTCRGRGVVRFVDLRKISVGSNTPYYVILLPFPYSCYALDMIIIITLLSPKCSTLQDEFELFVGVRITESTERLLALSFDSYVILNTNVIIFSARPAL